MDFLPLFLKLRDRPCVLVGGGAVAERKLVMLRRAGGRVTVVAPAVTPGIERLVASGEVAHVARPFAASDLDGAVLVIAATDDDVANADVGACAERARVPCNVVDQPEAGNVIMPSIVDRSPVVIAIGTGGNAPVLARVLRTRLEAMIPQAYGEFASLLGSLRERVRAAIPNLVARRRFWESAIEGQAAELLFAGRRAEAVQSIERSLADDAARRAPRGEVYLIGTGPGDPDLLTFRALRLMQAADVIVHDRLVSDAIVDLCRRDAERIFVGKETDRHAYSQEKINELLITLARAGKRAARLKGGDPFMFGRGGEEIEDLAAAGIDFQIVPGITAALGCASYAGIPLTHRDHAHSCVFITGHRRADGQAHDWSALARPRQTIVVYMGAAMLPHIAAELVAHGLAADTPAAIVERGTLQAQRVLTGTLADIAEQARAAGCAPPLLVIIGEVVRLRERLQWFERTVADGNAAHAGPT